MSECNAVGKASVFRRYRVGIASVSGTGPDGHRAVSGGVGQRG